MAGSQAGTVQLPEKTPPSSRAEVEIKPTAARMAAEAAWELASPEQWPGLSDAARFQLDANVGWWREYVHNSSTKNLETLENSQKLFRELLEVAAREPSLRSPQAALYWGYHLARAGFFSLQGMLSILATGLRQGTLGEQRSTHVWGGISIPRFSRTSGVGMLAEALPMFRQDLRFIQAGHYKLPWDMTTATHRQYNPFYVLDKAGQYVRDATRVLERRRNGEPEPVWLASPLYPSYYLNTFHYQTDGWLSAQSAQVYESQTETLFVGRQDAMQRLALVPLGQFIVAAERPVEELRLVELACGTGRFMTFIKDNHPRLKATAVDLSPFYLQEARSNVAYWKAKRQPQLPDQGGYKGTGVDFVQAAAERTGLPDASADVVSMTYLFHELPREARLEVLRESFRLLRPGGLLILTDSVQLGDRKSYDKTIDRFQHFNEPHWADYVKHDLGAAMEACGFHCGMKLVGSSTKCLTAVKPV